MMARERFLFEFTLTKMSLEPSPRFGTSTSEVPSDGGSENTYVRVIGKVTEFSGKRCINGFSLLPITDSNEITFHMLQAIHSHLRRTKSPTGGMVCLLLPCSFLPPSLPFSLPILPLFLTLYQGAGPMDATSTVKSDFSGGDGFTDVQKQVSPVRSDMSPPSRC